MKQIIRDYFQQNKMVTEDNNLLAKWIMNSFYLSISNDLDTIMAEWHNQLPFSHKQDYIFKPLKQEDASSS